MYICFFYQTNKCQSTIEYYNAYVHFWNKIIQINAFSQTSVVAYDMNYILAQFILEKFKKKQIKFFFLDIGIHSSWSSVVLIEGGTQSTSIGNSFSCDTICWVWMWNLARPSSNRFNWNTMSWKCLLSKSSNLTNTSDLMAANCFLARALHLRTNLK